MKSLPNLLLRSITGIIYVTLVIAGLYFGATSFLIIFAIFLSLCLWEFTTLLNQTKRTTINRLITTFSGIYLFLSYFIYNVGLASGIIFIPYLLSILYLLISELYRNQKTSLENWAFSFASHLYIAFPFTLLNTLAIQKETSSPYSIAYNFLFPLAIFILLWVNDTGAYVTGCTLSKYIPYKLFPRISPNKTWIGSIGGGVWVLGVCVLLHHYFATLTLCQWLGFGLIITFLGTWGDLVESLLKRYLNVKDSGSLLPGHGGFLDRFDSFLLTVPAIVIYLYLIL